MAALIHSALAGIRLSVPLTDVVSAFGVPALLARFVLETWLILKLGWLDETLLPKAVPAQPA